MSTASVINSRFRLHCGVPGAVFVGLFLLVFTLALWLYPVFVDAGIEPVTGGHSTTAQAAGGVGLSVFAAVEAGLVLGLIAVYRKSPDWLKQPVRKTAIVAFWSGIAIVGSMWFTPHIGLACVVGVYLIIQLAESAGLYWAINNLLVLGLAVYFGAAAGVLVGVVVLGVALVGLSVYDHVFANRNQWMFSIARSVVSWRLPAFFVVPQRWKTKWDDIASFSDDKTEDSTGFGIGMADLGLPAAFIVAVAYAGGHLTLISTALGVLVACFRLSWIVSNTEGGAGLPPLAAGTLGGWLCGAAAMAVV